MNKLYKNITSLINQKQLRGINIDPQYPIHNLFINDAYTQSDTDEQCIFHFPFTDIVCIKSIIFTVIPSDNQPSILNCYVNKPNITFCGIEDIIPTEIIRISSLEKNYSESVQWKYTLNLPKFQRVQHLTLFVEDNHGGEKSTIQSIVIEGRELSSMNMKNFKKCGG